MAILPRTSLICTAASALIVFSSGCGSGNAVVGKGPIQKRKYMRGWSIDFAKHEERHGQTMRETRATVAHMEPASAFYERPVEDAAEREPLASVSVRIPNEKRVSLSNRDRHVPQVFTSATERVETLEESTIKKRGALLSSPGQDGSSGGGTNGMAIAGFILAFFIPILGIIFSIIGLGQCKRRGQKGRGLAIAGIIISIVSVLIFLAVA